MMRSPLAAALLLSAALLTGCGRNADTKDVAEPTDAAAAPIGADGSDGLSIPSAPDNPLIAINARKSEEYIAAQRALPDVRELEGGFLFQPLRTVDAGDQPVEGDLLRFHYRGSLIDGDVFDDSRQLGSPLVVPSLTQIPVPGIPEALAQMKEGETARVIVPPALAFGEEGLPGMFEPNATLIFELDLVEVVTAAEPDRRAEVIAEQERLLAEERARQEAEMAEARKAYEQQATQNLAVSEAFLLETRAKAGVQATASGLLYEVIKDAGDGPKPTSTDRVRVHYHGTLPDGTMFDSSVERGEPTAFGLNQVIPGWTEGVALMNVGDKYRFYIPSDLAYGPEGTPGGPIGPNQALIFEVELLAIETGNE